jgi:L-glutamine-phosphate cytidylyltransferase
MNVVILAAGKGSRLGQENVPKPLTRLVNGQSLLEYQLEKLRFYDLLDKVIIVVGYRKEMIMETFPDLLYVYSPHFETENTSKSLLRALNKCQEDVLWLNGDVVFHDQVLEALLNAKQTSMVVNVGTVGEEEVKYRQSPSGRILEVSKHVKEPHGEALGINYCSAFDLNRFRHNLKLCSPHDYFERGLELCIEQGMNISSIIVDSNLCTEVDFPEDLEKANTLLNKWTRSI